MEIAIIDDLKDERILIRDLVNKYFEDRKEFFDVSPNFMEFENGETFLEDYTPSKYEIVFLDIYMDKITGIDVAKRIATLDKNCNIIFFTNSNEHQLDGYSVHAVGYIMKPVENNITALYTAMDYVTSNIQLDKASISILTNHGKMQIYFRNILYIDCIDRIIHIHLTDMVLKISGKYADYQEQFLSDNRFLECYRNVIVNMDYIDTPTDCSFIIKSGEKIPISRRKKSKVMENYMMYFVRKRGVR